MMSNKQAKLTIEPKSKCRARSTRTSEGETVKRKFAQDSSFTVCWISKVIDHSRAWNTFEKNDELRLIQHWLNIMTGSVEGQGRIQSCRRRIQRVEQFFDPVHRLIDRLLGEKANLHSKEDRARPRRTRRGESKTVDHSLERVKIESSADQRRMRTKQRDKLKRESQIDEVREGSYEILQLKTKMFAQRRGEVRILIEPPSIGNSADPEEIHL